MASALRERSASASIPSFTADASDVVHLPSLFAISPETATWLWTTAAIVLSLLVVEQAVWRYKKAQLPGDRWTIPVIGKFIDSMKPSLENYMKQWNSGALSAVSVFNMCVKSPVSGAALSSSSELLTVCVRLCCRCRQRCSPRPLNPRRHFLPSFANLGMGISCPSISSR